MINPDDAYKHRLTGTKFIVHSIGDFSVFVHQEGRSWAVVAVGQEIFNRDYVKLQNG